jgi:hypothetical protein
MRDQPRSSPRRLVRATLAIVAAAVGLLAVYSCSLIVETQSQQCQSTADCAMFGNATCDLTTGVCVSASTTSSSTTTTSSSGAPAGCDVDGGIAGGGCYDDTLAACPATTNAELLNACTTGCVPFDNSVRVPGLLAGDQLPELPTPGPDAGF